MVEEILPLTVVYLFGIGNEEGLFLLRKWGEGWKRDWFCAVKGLGRAGGCNGRGLAFAQGELLLGGILPLKDFGA